MVTNISNPPASVDGITIKTNSGGQLQNVGPVFYSNTDFTTSTLGSDVLAYEINLPTIITANAIIEVYVNVAAGSPASSTHKIMVYDGVTETQIGGATNTSVAGYGNIIYGFNGGINALKLNPGGGTTMGISTTTGISLATQTKLRIYVRISSGSITLNGYRVRITLPI